jgi:hypothetical protein
MPGRRTIPGVEVAEPPAEAASVPADASVSRSSELAIKKLHTNLGHPSMKDGSFDTAMHPLRLFPIISSFIICFGTIPPTSCHPGMFAGDFREKNAVLRCLLVFLANLG